MKKTRTILFYLGLAIYLYLLSDLFFRYSQIFDFGRTVERSVNLVPLKTILEYIRNPKHISTFLVVDNLLGNVLVFIPMGLYVQTMKRDKAFGKSLLFVAAASAAVELVQFAFGLGTCDVDDVILNTLGGVIGIVGYRLLRRVCRTEERAKTCVTVMSLAVGLPLLALYLVLGISA